MDQTNALGAGRGPVGRWARTIVWLSLAAVLGACSGAAPNPQSAANSSAPASPSPIAGASSAPEATLSTVGWRDYASRRNGYDVRIPPDWTATDASTGWSYGTIPNEFADQFWDRLAAPGGVPRFFGTSQKLPSGTVGADWICTALSAGPTSTCATDAFTNVSVGGVTASMAQSHTIEFAVATVVGGRGYLFSFAAASATRDQRQLLDTLLAGIRLQPEQAVD